MTIAEAREKCKSIIARIPRDVLIFGVIILSATLSFGFGYEAGLERGQGSGVILETPLSVTPAAEAAPVASSTSVRSSGTPSAHAGQVMASKNGTKYYLPDCPGASRISEANKVWFASVAAARAQGYLPAANCPGL